MATIQLCAEKDVRFILGLFIGIYRKYYQNKYAAIHYPGRWSQRGFVKNLDCINDNPDCLDCATIGSCDYTFPLISRTTLQRIEHGQLVKDKYYTIAINRLGFEYAIHDIDLDKFTSNLYETILFSKLTKIEKFKKDTSITFNKAKNNFLYNDFYSISIDLLDYQLYRKPIEKDILDRYLFIFTNLSNKKIYLNHFLKLLFYLIVVMQINFYHNVEVIDFLYEKTELFDECALLFYINGLLNYYRFDYSILNALDNIEKGLHLFKNQNNMCRCFDSLVLKANIIVPLDIKRAEEYYLEAENLLKECKLEFPVSKCNVLYYNLTSLNYFNKIDYHTALHYSKLQFYSDDINYYTNLIINIHLYSMLHNSVLKHDISLINKCNINEFKILFQYFTMKYELLMITDYKEKKISAKNCKDYIIQKISPVLESVIKNDFLINIFLNELKHLHSFYKNTNLITL